MQRTFVFYQNLGYWFLLIIPLVLIGFYPSYFSVFFKPTPIIVHVHFALMTMWVTVLIIQPFLFKYKRLSLHRRIGKLTYLLVPLVLTSAFLMMRLSYSRSLPSLIEKYSIEGANYDKHQVLRDAAEYQSLAFVYFFLLAIFYSLAIINRRRSNVHARYMVGAALTILGPTVDRAVYWCLKTPTVAGIIPLEVVAFFIADSILIFLLWRDYKEKRSTRTLKVCLSIFLAVQLSHFLFKRSLAWESFATFILYPSM